MMYAGICSSKWPNHRADPPNPGGIATPTQPALPFLQRPQTLHQWLRLQSCRPVQAHINAPPVHSQCVSPTQQQLWLSSQGWKASKNSSSTSGSSSLRISQMPQPRPPCVLTITSLPCVSGFPPVNLLRWRAGFRGQGHKSLRCSWQLLQLPGCLTTGWTWTIVGLLPGGTNNF